MSKTPFRMPQRPDNPTELDQWVAAGGEAATMAPPKTTESSSRAGEKMARLTIDLPPELHRKFKATCASKGIRMVDEVRRFIEEETQKDG